MIISGYGRKLPQFRGMNCTELATFSWNMADYFTTVLCRTFFGFSLLWHGCKKKVLCCLHSLCLLESCMRSIGHTRIKKMPEYYGQNTNLKPLCCCQGQLSRFPWREGRTGALQHPPGAGRAGNSPRGARWGCSGGVGCRWKREPRPH